MSAAYEQLITSATELNAVSDQLAQQINTIDDALKRLNLGVSTWVKFAGEFDPNTGDFWSRELGYGKVQGKWGIAIRATNGSAEDPEPSAEYWPFNDAPRAYRLEAVDSLAALLEKLVVAAAETAATLVKKVEAANNVALTVALHASLIEAQHKKNR